MRYVLTAKVYTKAAVCGSAMQPLAKLLWTLVSSLYLNVSQYDVLAGAGVVLLNEVLGGRLKVVEDSLLVGQHAGLVPRLTILTVTAPPSAALSSRHQRGLQCY